MNFRIIKKKHAADSKIYRVPQKNPFKTRMDSRVPFDNPTVQAKIRH